MSIKSSNTIISSGVPVKTVQSVEFTLTNAQFKALPTTSISFGIAPGAGFFNNVFECSYLVNTTAGAYTNIDPDFARLYIDHTSIISGPVNDTTASPVLTSFSDVFGASHTGIYKPNNPYVASYPVAGTAGWVINPDFYLKSTLENEQFRINAENNLAGDFTGGNVANSVTIRLKYYVEAI